MEQAKELIDQFCQEEYDSYADFSDLENVGIAYTTVTDEEIPIQVNVDLVNNRVERYLDGQFLERRQYSSLEGLIQTSWQTLTLTTSLLCRKMSWNPSGYLRTITAC